MNWHRDIKVEERTEKSVFQWLRDNVAGTDFVIYRISWSQE